MDSKTGFEVLEDRKEVAAKYFEEHKIHQLFELLCTQLVYNKPADPKAFLIQQLQKLKQDPNIFKLSLYTEEDIDTIFNLMDPVGRGYLTHDQVIKALTDMAIISSPQQAEGRVTAEERYNSANFRSVVMSFLR